MDPERLKAADLIAAGTPFRIPPGLEAGYIWLMKSARQALEVIYYLQPKVRRPKKWISHF